MLPDSSDLLVAAAAAVPAAVGVARRGLAVFGPPAEDLIGAVVAATARHARRGLVNLEPGGGGGCYKSRTRTSVEPGHKLVKALEHNWFQDR